MTTSYLADDLLRPEAYPWGPDHVERIETHISWVFLAGDRVVKVKRPVELPFVDHTTPEARRRSCENEARLNTRLTEDVYLGTVPITRGSGGHEVDGSGEPVEWATLMRRLPADRMLDELIAAGNLPEGWDDRLADRLVAFTRHASPQCDGAPEDLAAAAAGVVIDNVDDIQPLFHNRPFVAELGLISDAVRGFVRANGDLLLQRARDGWIREGHGDLRAEHICLDPDGRVQIFDCVEFSVEIRCADIASDLAFLLMDLDRLGVDPATADLIVDRYLAAGLELPGELLGLYWVHRALVRAKIAGIELAEVDEEDHPPLLASAAGYLHTAARHAVACEPVMIAMTGISGTGKSTVARQLARVLGADHHRSDVVRKQLAGREGQAASAWRSGLYGEGWTVATYARMAELGAEAIAAGRPVILDATFLDREQRDALAAMARHRAVPFMLVETACDEQVLVRRLEERAVRGDDPSDAGVAVMREQRAMLAEHPPGVPDGALVATIDTTPEGYVDLDPALIALRDAGIVTSRIGRVSR